MSEETPKHSWRSIGSWVFAFLVLAALIAVARQHAEAKELAGIVKDAEPAWLLAITALQLGTYAAAATSWTLSLRTGGQRRPLLDLASLSVAKLFVDQMVPSGGISGTVVMVKGLERRGIPRPIVAAGVVVDHISHYAAYGIALAVSLTILALSGTYLPRPLLIGLGIFTLVALGVPAVLLRLAHGAKLPAFLQRIGPLRELVELMASADRKLLTLRLIAACTPVQLSVMVLDATTVWAALRAVGTHASPADVFASFMVASMSRTVGIVPGGLGTFEAVLVAMLHGAGVRLTPALAAALLFRAWSFVLPMIPGLWLARRETKGKA